ncbi:hypothetical protein [Flaviflexus sp.]|uniref:hypothetical protein n=1 Tax=Flaviflexus sp. TaxID=1969482 RepID=UPI003F917FC9
MRAVLIGAKRDIDADRGIAVQSPIAPEFCVQTLDEGWSEQSKRMTVAGLTRVEVDDVEEALEDSPALLRSIDRQLEVDSVVFSFARAGGHWLGISLLNN